MRYAVLLIAVASLIGAGAPAIAGGGHGQGKGKGPPMIDECEAACLEDAAICLDAVEDELEECLASASTIEDAEACLVTAKAGAIFCGEAAKACLAACDD